MIHNGKSLSEIAPIKEMKDTKIKFEGTSYGLSEAGYDIRLAQNIIFYPPDTQRLVELIQEAQHNYPNDYYNSLCEKAHLGWIEITNENGSIHQVIGRFTLASAIEEFDMPQRLVGEVKDKSSHARKGLSVFNTVAEPGWKGFLTLELVFHGNEVVTLNSGQGIAQVLFGSLAESGDYGDGKYQNQENKPIPARE